MYKGQLKIWKDDKGFGFIQLKELKQDIFIHISTLKDMSRKPKIDDFIYFEIEKKENGKSRAVNCRIEGVAAKAIQRHKPRVHKNTSVPKSNSIDIGCDSYWCFWLSTFRYIISHYTSTAYTQNHNTYQIVFKY